METGSAARTNGTAGKPEDVKSPSAPKKEEEVKKTANPGGGEKEAMKGTGSASLETGQIKSSLFSGSDWKRPIIQFVESSDEKRSTYFSMDSADSKKMQYASGQIGDMRRPPLSFAEKGDLRKPLFSLDSKKSFLPSEGEGRKSLFSGGQMGDLKKTSLPLVETGDLRRPTFNKPDRAAGSRPRVKLEDVLCDSCIDNKQKAVKSCLVCQASFCELHLKPHLEGAAFRDHQLLDPIRDFEARKCPVHGKTMELFCQTDQMCICYLCMFQEHKNHSTVTVEIEKAGKEAELSLQKEQLQLKIIEVEDEMDKWQKERDRIKNYTTNEKATVDQHFKELIRDLERQRDEVKAALDQREKIASENVKEIVDELEERAKLLREDKENREQIHQISDSVLFLQEFGALMRNYVPPPSLPTYSVLLEGESMSPSMGLLRDDLLNVCMRHVEKICKADLGRNFIERNHMENGDHRYMMNNYEWNQPDNLKRFSMFLSPKVGNGTKLPFQFSSVGQNPPGDFSKQSDGSLFTKTAYPSIVRHQSAKVTPQTWKSSKQSVLSHYRPFYVNKGNGATSNEAP
ncbi:tripartite motif-containing protein 29 isoform X3 [Falco biarmicus]|uniref:tripartite motif-containing protein 29 isoform X3 n=1 Tax=Falco peregrinus TaxID=8954 RepID=UPI000FFC6438|nr:tripartite motif-containing protein 29 isoform X3 [Falco peregrinus]XP_027662613.1 tripartite motif-containing protein 29 isoform X3 [Falco cherrug]XP_037265956.1 tripartite motif-containing protein 29 isoform X3 [Falco rusticolus]XP_040472238.1 tripartite motif-containing protein 29 isoform X3 [Falco naumanni]XP_056178850.1 tripartite motif-containing protein 29 isoform X3 [Falco biarmicus]